MKMTEERWGQDGKRNESKGREKVQGKEGNKTRKNLVSR